MIIEGAITNNTTSKRKLKEIAAKAYVEKFSSYMGRICSLVEILFYIKNFLLGKLSKKHINYFAGVSKKPELKEYSTLRKIIEKERKYVKKKEIEFEKNWKKFEEEIISNISNIKRYIERKKRYFEAMLL